MIVKKVAAILKNNEFSIGVLRYLVYQLPQVRNRAELILVAVNE